MNKISLAGLILLIALLCSGCTSISKAEQATVQDTRTLDEVRSLGQTFRARFDGLDGIEIYLEPGEMGEGEIRLTLQNALQSQDLGRVSLPVSEIVAPGFYRFSLPVQADSNQKDYYVSVKLLGSGRVEVGTASGASYTNGALYQNSRPDDHHQMSFQLSYTVPRLALGILGETLAWCWYLLVAALLFVLPGWALLNLFWPQEQEAQDPGIISQAMQNSFTRVIAALGVGLALYPILFSGTHLMGLHLGAWYAWLPALVGGVYLGWQAIRQWKAGAIKIERPKFELSTGVLVLLLLLIIGTRFWAIRSLVLPLWGDSYHHTMIAQLMIDNNGIFDSWQPYTAAETFTYHFGFHAITTVFHWISQLPAAQAILVVGQLINIFAVLILYPLALLIFKNKWSGVVALLIAGLLSPMPMFYVNWGRYTQLAGQVFLVMAIWIIWLVYRSNKLSWQWLVPAWIVVGALAMTHYRVVIFFLAFIAAFLILHTRKNTLKPLISKTLWVGLGAGVLFLPWFINVFGGRIITLFNHFLSKPAASAGSGGTEAISYAIGNLTEYLPITIWISVVLVLAICLWQQKRTIATLCLWWLILILLANPHWLGLPGKGIIENFGIFIAAYIPAGLILAAIPSWLPAQSKMRWTNIIFALAIAGLAIWGAGQRRSTVNPQEYALATAPDMQAATWIQKYIDPEARFLVNTFFAFGDSVVVGSDGGWWLPLIAKRQTTLPPITYAFENEPFLGYNQWVQIPSQMIASYGLTHPETLATLAEYGITHVYIGQQQGSVNYAGPLRLSPAELQADMHFTSLYHQDRVWIFEFTP